MSSWDLGRTLTRRQALRAGAGGALGLAGLGSLGALSGCTVERALDLPEAGVNVKPKIDGDLLIYNWAQYMNPAIKKAFTEKYGVEVNEVNFDNLEAMVTKLRAGGQYDIIWPTPEYAFRLNQEGLLAHFDRDDLKNAKGISSFYDNGWWDPESKLSVPYTYYTTGIAWRTDEVPGMTESWNDMSNPEAFGKIFMLDDFQEGIGQANLLNGFYLNTAKPEELEVSKETLLEQKKGLRGFSTLTAQNLVNGTAAIHQAWNGDVVNARNQVDNPEVFKYETCSEGAGRNRPDVHPRHRAQPGHGAEVHRLDPGARQRGAERRLERVPPAGRGRPPGVREARQGGAVDRRQPRAARRRRHGVPARQPGGPEAVEPDLDRGESELMRPERTDARVLVGSRPEALSPPVSLTSARSGRIR
ncbi:MAG: spermidine/putrescine ABC transporter substrate-binding protein [Solirubrobacterales bacterium]|nr:spermidine/putrescine ABC transporter substrate-binding protein [Solirubrobacterales bacterium]